MEYLLYDKESGKAKARVSAATFAEIDTKTLFRHAIVAGELRYIVEGSGFEYGVGRAGVAFIAQPGDFFIKEQ